MKGITRWCEWSDGYGCNVGWGSVTKEGVSSCRDGSAIKNCHRTVGISAANLTPKAIKRLVLLGDIRQ